MHKLDQVFYLVAILIGSACLARTSSTLKMQWVGWGHSALEQASHFSMHLCSLAFRAQGNNVTRVFWLAISAPKGLRLRERFALELADAAYILRQTLQCWIDTIVRFLPTEQAARSVDEI